MIHLCIMSIITALNLILIVVYRSIIIQYIIEYINSSHEEEQYGRLHLYGRAIHEMYL